MFIVMTIKDNVPEDIIGVFIVRELAQKCFLDACSTRLSNWDEYDNEDKEALLDQGYEEFGNGSITYIDLKNNILTT